MSNNFDYTRVPFHYVHCLNQDCPRGGSCLRRLVALHIPKEVPAVMTVNPTLYPKDANRCRYFRSSEKRRYAWGISTLFDDIPYKQALMLKREIRDVYPKTTYYRILHQERPLSPEEQAGIAHIFTKNGVATAPAFNRYTEEYDWDE